MDNGKLPCGIPRDQHRICYERNCYLSGEKCPVHQGRKKYIIPRLPDYVHDSIVVEGVRIQLNEKRMVFGEGALTLNAEH